MSRRNDERSGSIQVGNRRWRIAAVATATLAIAALAAPAATGQATYTQRFTLRPGWNAIFLEVQPEPSEVAAVFATGCVSGCNPAGGVPLASVWTYDARFGGKVDDIVDPARGLIDTTGWYGFFPSGRAEAVLTNLFHLRVNRAYLVKIDGTTPATWTVTGRPSLRRQKWEADSFNLVGFPVAPDNPPSFGSWFEPSAAHRGQPIYRLDPVGIWQPVLPYFEPISSGQAYWVWTRGVSAYQGPLEVELDGLDRIEFSNDGARTTIAVGNLHDLDVVLRVRLMPTDAGAFAGVSVPLSYARLRGAAARSSWSELPGAGAAQPLTVPVPGGATALIELAPRRAEFSTDRVAQILEITNGLGSRRLIVVGANTAQSVTPDSIEQELLSATERSASTPAHPFAGLWLGTASVDRVVEARCMLEERTGCVCLADNLAAPPDSRDERECDPACPPGQSCRCDPPTCRQPDADPTATPTGGTFDLRVIVHVDGSGSATLLKEVIGLLRPAGTLPPDADGYVAPDPAKPAEAVLLTDPNRIYEFSGVVMRDGVPAGVRIATAAYDFDQNTVGWDPQTRGIPMTRAGTLGQDAMLSVELVTPGNAPTNPFRHRYHPGLGSGAPTVTRRIELALNGSWGTCAGTVTPCSADDDCGAEVRCESPYLDGAIAAPADADAALAGTYRETIEGVHREPLVVEGLLLLSRIATTATINPPSSN